MYQLASSPKSRTWLHSRARTSGHLEFLFTQPTRRSDWFLGLVLSRAAVLLGPLVLLLGVYIVFGLAFYRAGSEGPTAAEDMMRRDGFEWTPLAV